MKTTFSSAPIGRHGLPDSSPRNDDFSVDEVKIVTRYLLLWRREQSWLSVPEPLGSSGDLLMLADEGRRTPPFPNTTGLGYGSNVRDGDAAEKATLLSVCKSVACSSQDN